MSSFFMWASLALIFWVGLYALIVWVSNRLEKQQRKKKNKIIFDRANRYYHDT